MHSERPVKKNAGSLPSCNCIKVEGKKPHPES
jgi:hypothetical protein